MDTQILRTLGGIAGLAGLAVGMILLLYREIVRKKIFPTLSKRDAYLLLRNVAVLSWSIAMVGILCWAWSTANLHRSQPGPSPVVPSPAEDLVIAGTVVDQVTNLGVGQATITIGGESGSFTSEDSGNFRIVLTRRSGRVRFTVTKSGYLKIDQSVTPPTHDLILQMVRVK